MATVKCDKTGIEFEASSKRQKNHPLISALLNEASKDRYNTGTYRIAMEACEQVKANGVEDINEAIAYIRERMSGNTNAKLSQRAAEKRERKERNEERARVNRLLKAHGYTWHKEDEESMDAFGATAFETTYGSSSSSMWILSAPDGRSVSVNQALKEIEAQ